MCKKTLKQVQGDNNLSVISNSFRNLVLLVSIKYKTKTVGWVLTQRFCHPELVSEFNFLRILETFNEDTSAKASV